ncbi:MAG: hypothetical protein HKN72_06550 [Gemmatimonadetes bacterium]|nr:hypothetical protein [Gemmatimonadota bacterium]
MILSRATWLARPTRDAGGTIANVTRLTLLMGLSIAWPSSGAAQEGCVLGDRGRNDTFIQTLPGIGTVTYIGGAYFSCAGGVEIFADSAVAYQQRGMSELLGSVRYVEAERELRAARAQYFTNEGRLQAQGDVTVVDRENGSSIRDGDLVYLLQTDFRDVSEMTVTIGSDGVRPTVVLTPLPDTTRVDSIGAPLPPDTVAQEPYTVTADEIYLRGSGYFTASRNVVIERDSLVAFADSAEYDQDAEGLNLVDDARVVGTGYELTGRFITLTNPGGDASEVRALREARLVGADVLLTAARIVVLLRDGDLDRLVATTIVAAEGEPDSLDLQRPEALVEDFVLTADSLMVSAPGERLQRVVASGTARSVSTARDSLNTAVLPEVARTDWLEGDTVVIRFVGSPPLPPMRAPGDSAVIANGPAVAMADSGLMPVADSMVMPVADSVLLPVADSVFMPVADSMVMPVTTDSMLTAAPDVTQFLAEPDPADDSDVEEIIARGRARSLYRLPPNDSTYRAGTHPPAVHYVVGQEIRIRLESGGVEGMQVTGQTRGVHMEPLRRSPVADSARIMIPDSAAAGDTTAVRDTAAIPDTGWVNESDAHPGSEGRMDEEPGRSQQPNRNDDGGAIRLDKEHPWIRR